MIAWHVTDTTKIASIMQAGLHAGTYLAINEDVRDYYAETIADEGLEPVVITVDLSAVDEDWLGPDQPGIDEPLTFTLGMTEEEIWEAWEETDQSWRACAELIGSFRCKVPLSAALLSLVEDHTPAI